MKGKCKLCHKMTELLNSHVIPRFVIRWLKETSPGYIRSSENPNVRVQDGLKDYMLCSDCEQLFSNWERKFANEIFYPLHSNLGHHEYYKYGDWCLKFAVSVSWRVLTKGLEHDLINLSEIQMQSAIEAEKVWREFLLGLRKDPGLFCQHIVPFDIIENLSFPNPSPFLNRYLLRTIDIDIPSNNKSALVFVKLGRLIIFGIIDERYPNHWTGTKLHLRKGIIGRKKLLLPAGLDEYLNYRSNKAANLKNRMSETQKLKLDQHIMYNIDSIHEYEIFDAMNQDVFLFGDEAFRITNND